MITEHVSEGTGAEPARQSSATAEDQFRLLSLYRRIAEALARRTGASRVYLEARDVVARLLDADGAILCRIEAKDPRYLRVVLGSGKLSRLEGAVLPATGSFEGAALAGETVTVVEELGRNSSYFRTPEHRRQIGPAMAIRFETEDRNAGVLMVARAPGRSSFRSRHVDLLREAAAFIASGLVIGDPDAAAEGAMEAVEAWQEHREARSWIVAYEALLAERMEVCFRLGDSGRIQWGKTAARVFGASSDALPRSVDALLERLRPDERIAVQATIRDLHAGFAVAGREATCTFDAGGDETAPIRVRIWRGPDDAGVIGVASPSSRGAPDPEVLRDLRIYPFGSKPNGEAPAEALQTPESASTSTGRTEKEDGGEFSGEARPTETPPVEDSTALESMSTVVNETVERSDSATSATDEGPLGLTDLHSHLLVAVDDGAATEDEATSALARAYAAGVRSIVVTPHVRISGINENEREAAIGAAYARLVELSGTKHPDLRIYRGAEVMLDIPRGTLKPGWLRISESRFALVEFAGMWIPPRSIEVLQALMSDGFTPVVAHPERYSNAELTGKDAREWKEAGAYLQVNCGSLLGYYGAGARERAWRLLESGVVDYLASDYHSRGEYPVEECVRILESHEGSEQAQLLLSENPARLLRGESPLEVTPVKRPPTFLQRIVNARFFW